MNVGSLHPTLLAMLPQLHSVKISKGVCKGKSSWSFNRHSSLRHHTASITLHCHRYCTHATRFPIHCKIETRQKNTCTPLPRPGDVPFDAFLGNSFGAAHCRPQYIENRVVEANFHGFSHFANMKCCRKMQLTPLPRLVDMPFGVSPSPACGNSLGAGHFHPPCIENRAL